VTVFNGRGHFTARASIGETVKPGVVVALGTWWSKYVGGPNCNATTSTAVTDLGGGATFFDNLVEVEPGVRSQGSGVRSQGSGVSPDTSDS
jgi:anaerobic selenocysteine-containing dehydrogenase